MKSRTLNVLICLILPLAPEAMRAGAREYSVTPAQVSLETTSQASDTLATGFQENAESDETTQNEEAGERADEPTRIAVVVNKDNPVKSLEAGELKRIFMRQKKVWPNRWAIAVYERHTTNPIRRQFSKAVLDKKPSELKEYWLNRKLTLVLCHS